VQTAMNHPARGLILKSVLTNLADMSRTVFLLIPIGWAVRSRLDAVGKVPYLKHTKLFLHGTLDEIVTYNLGRKLFEKAGSPKTFYAIVRSGA
jgi:hypothetical protein